jgi:hypothetical protein
MRSWSGRPPNEVRVCGGGVLTCAELHLTWMLLTLFLSNGSKVAAEKKEKQLICYLNAQ